MIVNNFVKRRVIVLPYDVVNCCICVYTYYTLYLERAIGGNLFN